MYKNSTINYGNYNYGRIVMLRDIFTSFLEMDVDKSFKSFSNMFSCLSVTSTELECLKRWFDEYNKEVSFEKNNINIKSKLKEEYLNSLLKVTKDNLKTYVNIIKSNYENNSIEFCKECILYLIVGILDYCSYSILKDLSIEDFFRLKSELPESPLEFSYYLRDNKLDILEENILSNIIKYLNNKNVIDKFGISVLQNDDCFYILILLVNKSYDILNFIK